MSAEQMILTVLATNLAQAVAKDNDNPDGHDIASGLYGPAVSEWLREVAKELAPAEPVVLECKAGDLKALMRSHYERRPRAAAEQAEPLPAEYDVRTIMLDVVPGEDGHGHEVYAKSVNDVQAVLTRMGERIEELESRLAAPPAPAAAEQAEPHAWTRVVDEALTSYNLDVANESDDYATARGKMENLLAHAGNVGAYHAAEQAEPSEHRPDPEWYARMIRETAGDDFVVGPAFKLPERAEPVVWECKAGGLKPLTQSQYDRQSDAIKRHYSRIETPAPATTGTAWALLKEAYDYGQFGDDFDRPLANPVRAAIREVIRATSAADLPPNEELLALAERIDHDELWSRSVAERQGWTPEQRDRCDAGVHLRRYASLLGQDRWRIFPPKEGLSFSAKTLDGAIRMARNYEERHCDL